MIKYFPSNYQDMNMLTFVSRILLFFLLFSCENEQAPVDAATTSQAPPQESPKQTASYSAEELLARAVEAHGGERYNSASYGFVFRGKSYTFSNKGATSIYTVTSQKEGKLYLDSLKNGELFRYIDKVKTELTEKEKASAFEALNSVIYFATLPHKLLDPAVNLEKQPTVTIKGKAYDALKVYFDEEGGGTDHDDNFLYWINQETGRIDYFAYDYQVNGGGVRFRSAYNPRIVDGILFQHYVNFKVAVGTDLADLPALYEQGKMEELSRIETTSITALPY